MTGLLSTFTIGIYGVYILKLFLLGELIYYIHPRYISLSLVASIAGIAIFLICLYYTLKNKDYALKKLDSKTLIVLLILLFAIFTKPQTLTSSISQNRNQNIFSQKNNSNNIIISNQSQDYNTKDVGDWQVFKYIYNENDLKKYDNLEVTLTGFISETKADKDNLFLVTRFAISCCVVDASSFGLPVVYKNWGTKYSLDDWVEVKGNTYIDKINDIDAIIIDPIEIKKLDKEPENPYLY